MSFTWRFLQTVHIGWWYHRQLRMKEIQIDEHSLWNGERMNCSTRRAKEKIRERERKREWACDVTVETITIFISFKFCLSFSLNRRTCIGFVQACIWTLVFDVVVHTLKTICMLWLLKREKKNSQLNLIVWRDVVIVKFIKSFS